MPQKTFRNSITFEDHPLSHGLVFHKQHYYPPALSAWARSRVSGGFEPALPLNPSHVLTRQELDLVHRTGNAMTRAGNDHKSQSRAKAKALLETKQALQTVAERRRIRNRVQKSGHAYVSTKNIPNTIPKRIVKGIAHQGRRVQQLYRNTNQLIDEQPFLSLLGTLAFVASAHHIHKHGLAGGYYGPPPPGGW